MDHRSTWSTLDRNVILATLRAREPELRAAGIASLFLFGSAARGQATAMSDVDLFLDQANPEVFDLIDLVAIRKHIGNPLGGVRVDLATRGSLHPVLRPAIEASAVRVF